MLLFLNVYGELSEGVMVELMGCTSEHFVTLIEISMHLIEFMPEHILLCKS